MRNNIMSPARIAEKLGVGVSTVRYWCANGMPHGHRLVHNKKRLLIHLPTARMWQRKQRMPTVRHEEHK